MEQVIAVPKEPFLKIDINNKIQQQDLYKEANPSHHSKINNKFSVMRCLSQT